MVGHEQVILRFLDYHVDQMIVFLEEMVNVNSYSKNPIGLRKVLDIVASKLRQFDLTIETLASDSAHPTLVARYGSGKGKRVLLLGHADTVFAPEVDFQRLRREGSGTNERFIGPGVADMKGGIAIMCFAVLALLSTADRTEFTVSVLVTSDEELGSPFSRVISTKLAAEHDVVLVFEAAPHTDAVVVARRGIRQLQLDIVGKDSHSGAAPEEGINAVEELGNKIVSLRRVVTGEDGVSLNCGRISGGDAINRVSANACLQFEYRFATTEQEERLLRKIELIAQTSSVWNDHLNRGTHAELRLLARVPPWELTASGQVVLDRYAEICKELGYAVPKPIRLGSGSDANLVSQVQTAVLDGLGPVGGKEHTFDEFVESASLLERTKITAVLLHRLLSGGP